LSKGRSAAHPGKDSFHQAISVTKLERITEFMNSDLQNQGEKLYNALCLTLSERADQVDWNSFSENDWLNFSKKAQTEGVAPLIHWIFKHGDISGIYIPTKVKEQLKVAYYNTSAQNQIMYQELKRILEALNEANIPVIVLKGAALAATVYPEIGLRPMGDLDLLMPRDDIIEALKVIEPLKYTNIRERHTSVFDWDLEHHVSINKESDPEISLELHWNLISGDADWRSPDLEWFWGNSKPFHSRVMENGTYRSKQADDQYNQTSVFSLKEVPNILYLCNHQFLQHSTPRLIWIFDLNLIISQQVNQINWEDLKTKAIELNWAQAVHSGLSHCREFFHTPVPKDLIADLHELISQEDYINQRCTNIPNPKASFVISHLFSINKPHERMRFLFSQLFPNPEYVKKRYKPASRWIWPLLYPYRWLRIARELINTLTHKVSRHFR
jgi:hypothetical protein